MPSGTGSFALAASGTASKQVGLTEDLVFHYPFTDDAQDAYNSYDGTVTGSVSFTAKGAVFDGNLQHITSPSFEINSNWLISAWYRKDATQTTSYALSLGYWNNANKHTFAELLFGKDGDEKINARFGEDTSFATYTDSSDIVLDKLYHVALEHDATNNLAKLYVDKTLVMSESISFDNRTVNIEIAQHMDGDESYKGFNGGVASARYYNNTKGLSFVEDIYDTEYGLLHPKGKANIQIAGGGMARAMQYNPYGTAKIAIGAYGQATKSDTPRGSGSINISASGEATQYIPFGTGSIGISASGEPYRYPEQGLAEISISGTGVAIARNVLPTWLGCLIEEGFTQLITRGVKCLSSGYKSKNNTANAIFIVLDNKNMNDFYYWWVNTLNYGYDSFGVEFPFMGITRLWDVKITNDFTTSMTDAHIRKIPVELEVLDDVADYLPETSYGYVYPEEVGCVKVNRYSESSKQTSTCLGVSAKAPDEIMKGVIHIENNENLSKFISWYITELEYGSIPFTIYLPFMGTFGTWTAEFKEIPTISLVSGEITDIGIELTLNDYEPTTPN